MELAELLRWNRSVDVRYSEMWTHCANLGRRLHTQGTSDQVVDYAAQPLQGSAFHILYIIDSCLLLPEVSQESSAA